MLERRKTGRDAGPLDYMDEPRLSLARVSFDNCCVITQTSAGAPVPIDQGDTVKGTQITLGPRNGVGP